MKPEAHPASFRDPSGFVFFQGGQPHRFVAAAYREDYELLMASGLYDTLTRDGRMLPFRECDPAGFDCPGAWKVLQPEVLAPWSYPYEWSFSQLREAALLTLELNLEGLAQGMILKDAAAGNIQFRGGKAVLIDSLSFERYDETRGWKAFRQFCQHFLYPLLLMKHQPAYRPDWFQLYPDGIPAATAKALLPARLRYSLFGYLYLVLPARGAQGQKEAKARRLPVSAVRNNLRYLQSVLRKLAPAAAASHWSQYYSTTVLNDTYLRHKLDVIEGWFRREAPGTVTDLGANTGAFSLLAARYASRVVALDNDAASIDALHRQMRSEGITNLLPLVASVTQPSPAAGWALQERSSLPARIGADTVMALALVHHLCLTESVPLTRVFELLAELAGQRLIIEFVPKEDPMAQLLLAHREDVFGQYSEAHFEAAAAPWFELVEKVALAASKRNVYLFQRR